MRWWPIRQEQEQEQRRPAARTVAERERVIVAARLAAENNAQQLERARQRAERARGRVVEARGFLRDAEAAAAEADLAVLALSLTGDREAAQIRATLVAGASPAIDGFLEAIDREVSATRGMFGLAERDERLTVEDRRVTRYESNGAAVEARLAALYTARREAEGLKCLPLDGPDLEARLEAIYTSVPPRVEPFGRSQARLITPGEVRRLAWSQGGTA